MVLEAVIFCLDNSDWTRNGDYHPSRWDSQADAANLIAESKCEKNPENSIGIVSMGGKRVEVHVTLSNDLARILNAVKDIKLSGECDFLTALNISVLTLRHRQNKNQKQRIIMFVGSPIKHKPEEMVQMGKKLKKYNIAVDIISFGHVDENKELIEGFLNAVNNANNSSLLEVPTGYYIMDSLFSSPIMNENAGYDNMDIDNQINQQQQQQQQQPVPTANTGASNSGGMSQFERDINLAIQQSLEEEMKKQEVLNQPQNNSQINVTPGSAGITAQGTSVAANTKKEEHKMDIEEEEDEEAALEKARLLSIQEHEDMIKKKDEEEKKIKDDLMENQDFIKDILKGISSTDLNDDELKDVINQIKNENKDNDPNKKNDEEKK